MLLLIFRAAKLRVVAHSAFVAVLLLTDRALEGLRLLVRRSEINGVTQLDVTLKKDRKTKFIRASETRVRLLSGVDSNVLLQALPVDRAEGTHRAAETLLVVVGPFVNFEGVQIVETLGTLVTLGWDR